MTTSRRPVAAPGPNERAAIPGASLNHDAIAVQLCLSVGLDPATTDALLFRLKQELAASLGAPDGGRLTR